VHPVHSAIVSVPEHVTRYWRAQDALSASNEPTWWGAVVTDDRFPRVWDVNYARVSHATADLTMDEVSEALTPALRTAGAETFHVVSFVSDAAQALMDELMTAGHLLTTDLVMTLDATRLPNPDHSINVETLSPGEELWSHVRATFPLFGEDSAEAAEELLLLESGVMTPAGKRWLGIRDEAGSIVSVAAVGILDGVGYVDNVSTFPAARGNGFASQLTIAASRTALDAGASQVWLLADPSEDRICRMYRRLGFDDSGTLRSSRGPVPQP
jgi:ribosomal protein S18 acetylase RimI-like enzyme